MTAPSPAQLEASLSIARSMANEHTTDERDG